MIVDDERRTRLGITTIIEWEAHGFTIIDTAANGYEALTKYEKHRPDLCIIDIKMPGLTGLELVQQLREKDKQLKVIFLSGFAEFEYAQQAIRYQAVGYLLKPLEEQELIKYLTKVRLELDKEKQTSKAVKWKVEEENHRMITSALKGKITTETMTFFQHHLDWSDYTIMLLKVANLYEVEANSVWQSLRELGDDQCIVFNCNGYYGLLTSYDGQSNPNKELCIEMEAMMSEKSLSFCCAITSPVSHVRMLNKAFREAVVLLEDSFYYEEVFITTHTPSFRSKQEGKSNKSMAFWRDKLSYATELANQPAIYDVVSDMLTTFADQGMKEQEVKQQIRRILWEVTEKLATNYSSVKCRFNPEQSDFHELSTILQVDGVISFVAQYLIELSKSIDRDNQQVIVKKMKHFIAQHYHENIKLSMLADLLNYHKVYLGKIFKDSTGEYFNTYVDKLRIQKSKELLEQGYKVYEIAELVGYKNPDYFYTKFRKYEGISPSQYRKKHPRLEQPVKNKEAAIT